MYIQGLNLVSKPEHIAVGSWVIMIFDSIMTPGYDRDDPGDTVSHLVLYSTLTKSIWEQGIQKLEKDKATMSYTAHKKYIAFHVNSVAQIETLITVKVS
jgi:hypothetical protein